MKKLVTICTAIIIALNLIPAGVFAEETESGYAESINALAAFGVIGGDASEIVQEDTLTREKAALWVSKAMGVTAEYKTSRFNDVSPGSQYANGILALQEWGMVSGEGGRYRPTDGISYAEFVTVLVRLLQFGPVAEIYGGYPNGYVREAGNLKLNRNTNAVSSESLTVGEGAQILYNAVQVRMYDTEKTPLKAFLDIDMAEGRVTKDSKTGISEPDGVGDGRIMIGDTVYLTDMENTERYLGKKVTLFYTDENGSERLVHIEEDGKYKEMSLTAADILPEKSDRRTLVYENNDREYRLKISPAADIIYNGKAYPDLPAEELYPECGDIRLLDSDNDNVYDVLFITKYDVFWVLNAVEYSKTVYNKFSGEGFLSEIKFESDAQVDYFDAYGEEMSFSDISTNSIVMVAASKTGANRYYRVVIPDNVKKSRIESIEEDCIILDGEEYDKSAAFKMAEAAGQLPALDMSVEYYIYFDIYGEAVLYDKVYEGNRYGYLKRAYTDEETEKTYVKVFTEDTGWQKYELREKVKFNNEEYSDSAAAEHIKKGTMIRYQTDSKGRIKQMETAVKTSQTDKELAGYISRDEFRCAQVNNLKYYSMNKSFDNSYFTEEDVKVFLIPTAEGAADEDFRCTDMSYFVSETRYTADVYDMDEFMFSSLIVIEYDSDSPATLTSSLGHDDYCMMVNKVMEIYVDDEVVSCVKGVTKGQEWSYTAAKAGVFSKLKRGDVIRTKYDDAGKINHYITVHSVGDEDKLSNAPEINNSVYLYGEVLAVDYENNRIRINQGTNLTITTANSPYITVYEMKDNEVRNGTLSDIRRGDYAVFRMRTSVPFEIFVYKQ